MIRHLIKTDFCVVNQPLQFILRLRDVLSLILYAFLERSVKHPLGLLQCLNLVLRLVQLIEQFLLFMDVLEQVIYFFVQREVVRSKEVALLAVEVGEFRDSLV